MRQCHSATTMQIAIATRWTRQRVRQRTSWVERVAGDSSRSVSQHSNPGWSRDPAARGLIWVQRPSWATSALAGRRVSRLQKMPRVSASRPLPPPLDAGVTFQHTDKVVGKYWSRTATWRRVPREVEAAIRAVDSPRGAGASSRALSLAPIGRTGRSMAEQGAALSDGWIRPRAGSRAHFQQLFGSPYRHPRGDAHPEALSWSGAIAIELVREQVAFVVFLEDVSPIRAPEPACEGVVGLGKALINPVSECVVETVEGCPILTGHSRGPESDVPISASHAPRNQDHGTRPAFARCVL